MCVLCVYWFQFVGSHKSNQISQLKIKKIKRNQKKEIGLIFNRFFSATFKKESKQILRGMLTKNKQHVLSHPIPSIHIAPFHFHYLPALFYHTHSLSISFKTVLSKQTASSIILCTDIFIITIHFLYIQQQITIIISHSYSHKSQ